MTPAKHTPGPWNVAPGFESTSQYRNRWRISAQSPHVTGKMQTICELNGPWDEKNYAANAHLIAASPELLEACESSLKVLLMDSDMEKDFAPEISQLRTAILKARGQ